MSTDATNNPQVQDDSEEDEKHLALLIHQAGEDTGIRTKKFWPNISKNLTT